MNIGIRTIAPRGKLPPGQGWGFGQGQGQFQGWGGGGNQTIAPEENCPAVTVRRSVRVSFGVGGQFSQNHSNLTPCVTTRQHMCKKSFALFLSCEFCESVNSTYLVKHFDRHKMTTENYCPLSQTSLFFELGITEGGQSGNLALASIEK